MAAGGCPVGVCEVTGLPSHLLMCTEHWALVPLPLKREVYRTWRRRQQAVLETLPAARANHEHAKDAAVQAAEDQLAAKG